MSVLRQGHIWFAIKGDNEIVLQVRTALKQRYKNLLMVRNGIYQLPFKTITKMVLGVFRKLAKSYATPIIAVYANEPNQLQFVDFNKNGSYSCRDIVYLFNPNEDDNIDYSIEANDIITSELLNV